MTQQSIFRNDPNWRAGYRAFTEGKPVDACPFPNLQSTEAQRWIDGWNAAREDEHAHG